MKKNSLLLILLMSLMGCSASVNTVETNNYENNTNISEKEDYYSHKNMTRGEIMTYEMGRVKEEFDVLEKTSNLKIDKTKMLKEYKMKLEELDKLNKDSMK